MEVLVNRWKWNPYGLVVRLLICAVCTAIASRAGATPPVGRTIELVREAYPLSFGTATTSEGAVVAWVAQDPDGVTALKTAWIPWNASVAGEVITLAKDVGGLPPQLIARDDGSVWILYADRKPALPGPSYPTSCDACSIQARIISAAGPVGDAPVTLAVPDGILYQFHAGARPDGGLLLWWWHQDNGQGSSLNHESTRAFDSQGIPLARGNELLAGGSAKFVTAAEGGALRVSVSELSEQGSPYMQVYGAHFDNNGAFFRSVELTPPISSIIEGVDLIPAAAGGYWMTWHVGGEKPRARRVAAGGRPGRVFVVGSDPTTAPLAPTPDDGFVVCWATYSRGRLFVRLHGADARPRGGPILIARGAIGSFPRLQLAVNAAGLGVVAWWSRQFARDGRQALFLTQFTASSQSTQDR
jgi:hypothetical protein